MDLPFLIHFVLRGCEPVHLILTSNGCPSNTVTSPCNRNDKLRKNHMYDMLRTKWKESKDPDDIRKERIFKNQTRIFIKASVLSYIR